MSTTCCRTSPAGGRGFTLLEILVTIVILAFGLLGVAGLQARIQVAEVEAYQRAQAIVLVQDMVDRLNANRRNGTSYVTGTPAGTGPVEDCSTMTGANLDLCEWGNALRGASEKKGASSVGAMIGARGCITNPVTTMPREFKVAVVWQGLAPTISPASTTCGQGQYGTDDKVRRAMVATVVIGCLQNDPATGLCVTP